MPTVTTKQVDDAAARGSAVKRSRLFRFLPDFLEHVGSQYGQHIAGDDLASLEQYIADLREVGAP